jgi:hypothetical protein
VKTGGSPIRIETQWGPILVDDIDGAATVMRIPDGIPREELIDIWRDLWELATAVSDGVAPKLEDRERFLDEVEAIHRASP